MIGKSNTDNHSVVLKPDEWDRATKALDNPPQPNEKMKALFKRGYKVVKQEAEYD